MTLQGYLEEMQQKQGLDQRCDKRLGLYSDSGVLSRLINTDQMFSSFESWGVATRLRCSAKTRRREKCLWWGRNLPNNVRARLNVVVEEGQARVGNKISEAHVCWIGLCVW